MKRKVGFTGTKTCPDGELYRFKKGVAKVPGCRLNRKDWMITFQEFIEGTK